MAMVQTAYPGGVPPSSGGPIGYDSASGLYYEKIEGNLHRWVGAGAPAHSALSIGDEAINVTTGDRYNATDTAGTWELLSAQS